MVVNTKKEIDNLAEELKNQVTEKLEKDLNRPVTAEEIEAHLISEAKKEFENSKPEDIATRFFEMYFPLYKGYLMGLSNKDARRVCEHLVQYPLKDQDPKFNDKNAREAFQIGTRLLEAKRIMANVVHLEHMQEVLAEKQKREAEASEVKEESNGKVET
jgi:hypothetical protein